MPITGEVVAKIRPITQDGGDIKVTSMSREIVHLSLMPSSRGYRSTAVLTHLDVEKLSNSLRMWLEGDPRVAARGGRTVIAAEGNGGHKARIILDATGADVHVSPNENGAERCVRIDHIGVQQLKAAFEKCLDQ